MISIAAASGDNIDYCSRCLPELRLIPRRQHLKFGNCLLIELGRSPTIDSVFIRLAVDHEVIVSCSLAQHRGGVVSPLISLAIHNHSGYKL